MGKYNGAVITTAGQNFFASAIAGGNAVTFTTMVTSSYAYPASAELQSLTSLQDVVQTSDISYAGVYNNNVVQVSARFDNTNVISPYLINTLGLYAQVGSETPVLVAVITAVTPDQMPVEDPESPSAFIYNVQMTVQNAQSLNVTVNPAGTVTVDMLKYYVEKITLDSYRLVTVPITGWEGSEAPYSVNIPLSGITEDSVPFPFVYYDDSTTKAQKKAIDKSAALFTKLYTQAGAVVVKACSIPQTAVTLALRGA